MAKDPYVFATDKFRNNVTGAITSTATDPDISYTMLGKSGSEITYEKALALGIITEEAANGTYDPRVPIVNAGAPVAGTDEVQTITYGGTPTGGTHKFSWNGNTTSAITWSATNATLVANVQAALRALDSVGGANVTVAVGTMTAGIGTLTVTFGAALGKLAIANVVAVADNSLTGTDPTIAVAETTPGVTATGRGAGGGQPLIDTTNKFHYTNTGTANAPTWTKTGTQS